MKNVFQIDKPRKYILAFTTQSGHATGKLMKGIKYRTPEVIEKLQKVIQENDTKIGDFFVIDYDIFVVLRKHYNSKIDIEKVDKILENIKEQIGDKELKTTNEDYPQLKAIIVNHFPNIEFRDSSAWGVR